MPIMDLPQLPTVLVALATSLVTVLVTKQLEERQATKRSRYLFGRMMYRRRLEVAERATTRLLRFVTLLGDEIALARLHLRDEWLYAKYVAGVRKRIDRHLREISRQEAIYPFLLYFDVEEHAFWPDSLMDDYHTATAGALRAAHALDEAGEQLSNAEGTEDEERVQEAFRRAKDDVRKAHRRYVDVLVRQRDRQLALLAQVKAKMREYEEEMLGSGGRARRVKRPAAAVARPG
jgi:hypothetical protein